MDNKKDFNQIDEELKDIDKELEEIDSVDSNQYQDDQIDISGDIDISEIEEVDEDQPEVDNSSQEESQAEEVPKEIVDEEQLYDKYNIEKVDDDHIQRLLKAEEPELSMDKIKKAEKELTQKIKDIDKRISQIDKEISKILSKI